MIIRANFLKFGQNACFREVLPQILDELPELNWGGTRAENMGRIINSTEELDERIEITVRTPEGALVGFAVLVNDEDDHVGECLGTQWHWVHPDHRGPVGRLILRAIIRLASHSGYKVVAYTKRLGVGRYEINYKQLKENTNGQED
uniref:GNAT family N-acetyltransferase n=1 Tax=Pseudomonas phage Ghuch01 TaxID=3138535 RepID=A0AAU6W305_9CAUD